MPLHGTERERLIQQYADGPDRLKSALAKVPAAALTWRPAPGQWSAHEIVCYAEHLEGHARQIEDNLAAWHAAGNQIS